MSRTWTNLTAVLISATIISISFANPFLSKRDLNNQGRQVHYKKDNETPYKRDNGISSPENVLKQPLPPLPAPSTEKPLRAKWIISGRVNDKVIVTDGEEERLVDNGDYIEGCVVQYPTLFCGDKKDNLVKLSKHTTELRQKVALLQDELKRLEIENNELSLSEREKQQQINDLIEENRNLDTEVSILQARVKEYEEVLSNKESEIKLLKDDNELKTSIIERLKKELSVSQWSQVEEQTQKGWFDEIITCDELTERRWFFDEL